MLTGNLPVTVLGTVTLFVLENGSKDFAFKHVLAIILKLTVHLAMKSFLKLGFHL